MITVGIDEVGRGCWAGPLVAGAVILPADFQLKDCSVHVRDSKKLTKKQRELTAKWVHENALAVGLGWVEPREIDAMGLTESVRQAMSRALEKIRMVYDEIIVDGNINYFADDPRARAVVRADDSVSSVSAASIIAKVARDAHMADLDKKYAGYGFARHVGYGTAEHIAALQSLGVSDMHRRSYKPVHKLLT